MSSITGWKNLRKVTLAVFEKNIHELKRAKYMEMKLLRTNVDDAKQLHTMQIEAFRELLEKYQDFDTNPGNESLEKVETRLKQDCPESNLIM